MQRLWISWPGLSRGAGFASQETNPSGKDRKQGNGPDILWKRLLEISCLYRTADGNTHGGNIFTVINAQHISQAKLISLSFHIYDVFKADTSLVAILVIAIVISVVAIFSFRDAILQPGETFGNERQRLARESVSSFLRSGSVETIQRLGMHGGYLNPRGDSVKYQGMVVNYAEPLQNSQLEANFVEGLNRYIAAGKEDIEKALANDSVVLGDHEIEVRILENKVMVTVSMQTDILNATFNQPYQFEISTDLGQMHSFSRDFLLYSQEHLFFENFTMASIQNSPESGVNSVPLYLTTESCEQGYEKTWHEIRDGLVGIIRQTVSLTTYADNAKRPDALFEVKRLDERKYDNLKVSFALPDKFTLENQDLVYDPYPLKPESLTFMGVCLPKPVIVKYWIRYPVVVSVEDSDEKYTFALPVYIENSGLGEAETEPEAIVDVCENPKCMSKISVSSQSGSVSYADVLFMGCMLGKTDENGVFDRPVPCGSGQLEVKKEGYDDFSASVSSGELINYSVSLDRDVLLSLRLYSVEVEQIGNSLRIKDETVRPNTKNIHLFLTNKENEIGRVFESREASLVVPEGIYAISAEISEDGSKLGGFVSEFYEFNGETMNVYIYVPYVAGYSELGMSDRLQRMTELTSLLGKCLDVISQSPATPSKDCELTL